MDCEICGKGPLRVTDRCTNRVCLRCHGQYCTEGGSTYPGHGLNLVDAREDHAHKSEE